MMKRHGPKHGEKGASLIIVLIVISVIGMVMGVVMSQTDTSVRASVALRDQAADDYGADGATQAILNGLKTSGINCSDPSNPTGVALGSTSTPFYVPASTVQGPLNAYAKCTPDALVGAATTTIQPPPVTTTSTVTPAAVTSTSTYLGQGDPTLPSYALLTTGSTPGDFGIDISQSANNKPVCIENGSVASNADINTTGQTFSVRLDPSVTGQGTSTDCSTGTGTASDGSKLVITAAGQCITGGSGSFAPTSCTPNSATVSTPVAPPLPTSVGSDNPAPTCSTSGNTTYAAFQPGHYTTADVLNSPCSNPAKNVFEWLSPGNYFMDFSTGSTTWTWPTTVVGGTPTDSTGNAISGLNPKASGTLSKLSQDAAAPNACADPASGSGVLGVQIIFSGSSTASAPQTSTSEFCASSPSGSPPVAFYGLQSATTVGSVTLPAETMCGSNGCGSNTLIATTTSTSSAQAAIYIKGYVYAPNAQVIMSLKNSIGQLFNWGIVVRNFRLSVNGSSPTSPFVQLPKPNTGVGTVVTTSTPPPYPTTAVNTPASYPTTTYTIRYINVWTCLYSSLSAASPTCPTSGSPNVQVKVLTDTSGKPVQILSWNHV